MSEDSYYWQERRAALSGVPYYDTRVGVGYDQVPTSVIYKGFGEAFNDKRGEDADVDPRKHKNLPQWRAALYEGHNNDELPEMGYYKWDDERIALDMAPDFVKARVPQRGQIGDCLRAHHRLPLPHLLNNNVPVYDAGERQRDGGNPIGVLYDPPALGPKKNGTLFTVPAFF
jgi:hypothetical protein